MARFPARMMTLLTTTSSRNCEKWQRPMIARKSSTTEATKLSSPKLISRISSTTSRRLLSSSKDATTRNHNKKSVVMIHNEHPLMVSKTNMLLGYSMSEIAGNVSFIFVCIAYMNTDILMLRLLSMGSISLSILFQYFRSIPLWIPIRWNVLLLGINTVMTASLMAERRRADNMPANMERIYREGAFEKRGFSKVEFMHLFEMADRVTMKRGDKLAEDGRVNQKLYFVVKGNIRIERNGKQIAMVTPNHFIGEMTFLDYLLADDVVAEENAPPKNAGTTTTTATADALVGAEEVVAYVWNFDKLKDYLRGEREVRNALSAYMNHDLRAKLASLNNNASPATNSS